MEVNEKESIALHVLVIGFHHKKGMQVDYAYPPFCNSSVDEGECQLPEKWKHLPSLCLPDGAHNHEADTVYFHLPHLTNDTQTVFGVSCYRQIDAEKVMNKTADITRNTVQKSVCVLTTLPIYGYVQERLKVTTKVYFKMGDFSDVRDLEALYHDLNGINWKERLLHGICASDVVRLFGRNILVLFKLLLLERRVLFHNGCVAPLVKAITSLLALLPGSLPDGLAQSAATSNFNDIGKVDEMIEDNKVQTHCLETSETMELAKQDSEQIQNGSKRKNSFADALLERLANEEQNSDSDGLSERPSSNSSLTSVTSRGSITSPSNFLLNSPPADENGPNLTSRMSVLKGRLSGALNYWTGKDNNPDSGKPSTTATPNPSPSEPGDDFPVSPTSNTPLVFSDAQAIQAHHNMIMEKYSLLELSQCGLPLQIFTKGNLLHPYLSLQYLEVLTAPSTRAFLAGVSNALFVHKKNLYDVSIQVDDGKIDITDPELKRELSLTTEDLRFAENIVKQVEAVAATSEKTRGEMMMHTTSSSDVFLEGIGWLGGEEWLRHQFKIYLLSMLRISVCPQGSREYEVFNGSFMDAWKQTHNYRMWSTSGPYEMLIEMESLHPYAGSLSMADMRIKLSHAIQGMDKGKRLNQTLANTGTAVLKTKEAVGGALSTAKGAISTLWTSLTATSANATVDPGVPEEALEAQEQGVHSAHEGQHLTQDASSSDKAIEDLSQGEAESEDIHLQNID